MTVWSSPTRWYGAERRPATRQWPRSLRQPRRPLLNAVGYWAVRFARTAKWAPVLLMGLILTLHMAPQLLGGPSVLAVLLGG